MLHSVWKMAEDLLVYTARVVETKRLQACAWLQGTWQAGCAAAIQCMASWLGTIRETACTVTTWSLL